MDLNYRAKQMQLFVSDDGTSFNSVGSLTFEDDSAPTAVLSEPVTARYFRCRFTKSYGNGRDLAINEIYFKNEYRLDDLKVLAAELIGQEDCFSGYRPEALEELKAVYDDGNVSDATVLREAIARLGENAQPLSLGCVDKASHITSFTAYQLHNPYGYGDLVASADGRISLSGVTVDGALEDYQRQTHVSDLFDNWLILRSEDNDEYYIYNLGMKKYINVDGQGVTLSDAPMGLDLTWRSEGFTMGVGRARVQLRPTEEVAAIRVARLDDACVFQLRNNYALSPNDQDVRELLRQCEDYLHGGGDGIIEPSKRSSTSLSGKDVVVVNIQGIEMYRGRYESMPHLPAGVYILQSGDQIMKKLIRE